MWDNEGVLVIRPPLVVAGKPNELTDIRPLFHGTSLATVPRTH